MSTPPSPLPPPPMQPQPHVAYLLHSTFFTTKATQKKSQVVAPQLLACNLTYRARLKCENDERIGRLLFQLFFATEPMNRGPQPCSTPLPSPGDHHQHHHHHHHC